MRSILAVSLILLIPCLAEATAPILPDSRLTPGATLPVTVAQIAQHGYSRHVRDVSEATKLSVYAEYHITPAKGQYEVDHLISLELGGSNSVSNLWPEAYHTRPWNARVKDKLENRLHELVCSGRLNLSTAQHAEATNWIAAYQKYFHTKLPFAAHPRARGTPTARHPAPHQPMAPTGAAGPIVWVNTDTGVYHYLGSRWYEATKQGKLITESAARAAGDRAAENGQ